jgi:hypothetical protein
MHAVALEKLVHSLTASRQESFRLPRWRGSCKVVPSWILYAGSVLADEVFMDPRRLFGGSSAAIEERERPQSPPQEELLCLPRKWLSLP